MRRFLPMLLLAGACHSAAAPTTAPAVDGVHEYMAALKRDDSSSVYAMLSADARKKISATEFALQWKQSEKERLWQAAELERSIKGNPNVGERAVVRFSDGKLVELERDGATWRLESDRVARSRARRPEDAIRLFADAVANRDVTAILGVLTQRRRDGLTKQVEGFLSGLGKRMNDHLDVLADRAELRWDENGLRYRIILRLEDGEWRVDDISIRPSPHDEEPVEKPGVEGTLPEDF